jgi:hypothetical protein
MKLIVFNLFFCSVLVFSQISDLKPILTKYKNVKESAVVTIGSQELLFLFLNQTNDSLFSIRTTNLGYSWQPEQFIQKIKPISVGQQRIYLNAIKTNSNRIIVAWTIFRDSITV